MKQHVVPAQQPQLWKLRLLNQVLGVQRDIFSKFQQAIQSLNAPVYSSLASNADSSGEMQAKAMIQELALSSTQTLLDLIKFSSGGSGDSSSVSIMALEQAKPNEVSAVFPPVTHSNPVKLPTTLL